MMTPTVDVTLLGESLATVSAIVPTNQWPVWLQLWLTQLDPAHSPLNAYEMSLQFTTDATIAQLNRDYRQQDQATDVLSFAALEDAPLPPEVLATIPVNLGDLIVSVETAQRQCEAHGHSLTEELAWLVAHGLLHLLGWDHPTEDRLQAMWTLQRSLLAQVGLSLPATAYTIDN
ncbi:MAG: rRNA maturation RNase YbeY [Cyanobacteria bacterium J06607_6]